MSWFRRAADQGNSNAQVDLGGMYETGEGVREDLAQAASWYRRAADQGNSSGQFNLGTMYEKGEGVPKDPVQAANWYRRAADQGHSNAQFNIGVMYATGEGVPTDLITAYMWFNLSAAQGVEAAKTNRDSVERQMSRREIAEAQRLASEWGSRNSSSQALEVVLHKQGGVLQVPVVINNSIALDFVLDSGASDVSIPADVVSTLMRTGTLTKADFTGTQTYVLADGSSAPSQTFSIRSLKVGGKILQNVSGSVAPANGALLLGQSFLSRFKSWSIDNERQVLLLQ